MIRNVRKSSPTLAIVGAVVVSTLVSPVALGDVHLTRNANGSVILFNDDVGSGWRIRNRAPSDSYLQSRRSAPTPYDDHIRHHSALAGVDPTLVKSVMLVESNFNPRAVSRKGACGLMQLMPFTARMYGVQNSFDAEENIRAGAAYLSNMLGRFSGNVSYALAAYNAGPGAVERYSGIPPYPETQEYVRRAMIAYSGSPVLPTLGGGFKGLPVGGSDVRPVVRKASSAPVRLLVADGGKAISNGGMPRRAAPVLGRIQ